MQSNNTPYDVFDRRTRRSRRGQTREKKEERRRRGEEEEEEEETCTRKSWSEKGSGNLTRPVIRDGFLGGEGDEGEE
jgi:hypothetical protein